MNQPSRRTFLKGAGASLALPMLESISAQRAHATGAPTDQPRRLVCVGSYLGFYQSDFFPTTTGRDYDISPVLKPIDRFRDEMSIFSGLDHRGREWSRRLASLDVGVGDWQHFDGSTGGDRDR